MKALSIIAIIALIFIASANAASLLWTGYANNNQWSTPTNWYPAQIPGAQDDVTIHNGTVIATDFVNINSLVMGDHLEAKAYLTIDNGFNVFSSFNCYQNGAVTLASGSAALSGSVTIKGAFTFQSGSVSGAVDVSGNADLSSAAAKTITSGTLSLSSTSVVGGVIQLVNNGNISISGTSTWGTNAQAAAIIVQAVNSTNAGFDFSKGSVTLNSDAQFQANGAFGGLTISNGVNMTLFNNIQFANTINIPNSSFVTTVGSASINAIISGGGAFISVGASTTFGTQSFAGLIACNGASCTFGGTTSSVGNLVLGAGATTVSSGCALSAGILSIQTGSLAVSGSVSAGQLNFLGAGSVTAGTIKAKNFYSSAASFNLGGGVVVSGAAQFDKTSINFGGSGLLHLASGSTSQISNAVTFQGPNVAPGVTNDGSLSIKANVIAQGINLAGTGTISISGASVYASAGAQVAASNIQLASGGSVSGNGACINAGAVSATTVKAKLDSYSLSCSGSCSNVASPCTNIGAASFSFSS